MSTEYHSQTEAKPMIDFKHYTEILKSEKNNAQELKKTLEELINKIKLILNEKQAGEAEHEPDIAYYETVLKTQSNPEIIGAELADLIAETRAYLENK